MRRSPDVNNLQALEAVNTQLSRSLHNRRQILTDILKSILPGGSITDRARLIGISRQTLYDWMSGKSHPNHIKAKRLAQLTGIPWQEFRS